MRAHQQKGGGLAGDMLFYPFGQEWAYDNGVNASWWQFYNSFSRWSADLGFDLTPNRKYSPALGRWMTPDPSGMAAASPSNPQTWNLYAYVLNNPTSLIDTSGLDTCPDGSGSSDSKTFCIKSLTTLYGITELPINFGPQYTDGPSFTFLDTSGISDLNNLYAQNETNGPVTTAVGGPFAGGRAARPAPRTQIPNSKCAGLEKKASQLALTFSRASYASGFGADTVGVLAGVSGIGDLFSLGAGTPVTVTLIAGAGVLDDISRATGAAAASLNSFARGNAAALEHFGSNQILVYADKLLADHISPITEAGMDIVDAVQQAKDLANAAKGVCQ